ncbi:hypothetical protein AC579_59 [Pseudocercospora musae]|uniref:Uncharacterized protein n=1 Tax=Pseudocercospora musae TaxID=113226 RepID=A0A139IA59_9PEZI|nr:hypothetical protein AC579_59 [Pseudocercospora musae]
MKATTFFSLPPEIRRTVYEEILMLYTELRKSFKGRDVREIWQNSIDLSSSPRVRAWHTSLYWSWTWKMEPGVLAREFSTEIHNLRGPFIIRDKYLEHGTLFQHGSATMLASNACLPSNGPTKPLHYATYHILARHGLHLCIEFFHNVHGTMQLLE